MEMKGGCPEGFKWMFDVEVNAGKWIILSVGKDPSGRYILHESVDYAQGASIATAVSHAVLTRDEYLEQLDRALANKRVSAAQYEEFKEQ